MSLLQDIRSYIVGAMIILSGGAFWYLAYDVMRFGFSFSDTRSLVLMGSLLIYLIGISLGLIFFSSYIFYGISVGMSVAPMMLTFGFSPEYIPFWGAVLIAALYGFSSAKSELLDHVTFRTSYPLRRGLPILLTSYALLLAAAYYFSQGIFAEITTERIFPRYAFTAAMRIAESKGSNILLPGFNEFITVDEYIAENLKKESGLDIRELPLAMQENILSSTRTQVFRGLGVESVSGNANLGDAFYAAITKRIDILIDPYRKLLPLAVAIGLFIIFKTIAIPITWIVMLIMWGVLHMLIFFRIAEVQSVERPHEYITWRHIERS